MDGCGECSDCRYRLNELFSLGLCRQANNSKVELKQRMHMVGEDLKLFHISCVEPERSCKYSCKSDRL